MRKDNEQENMQLESRPKNFAGFNRLMQEICDHLVEKGLIDAKEAFRFMGRPDERYLSKIRRLLLTFADRGPASFDEFLSVLRNIESYPKFSSLVRKVVDNFEVFLKATASDSPQFNAKRSCKMKRSNDLDQNDENYSAKRSKSELDIHSTVSNHDVRREVSGKTAQKALYRKSCPANICWEDQIPSQATEGTLLMEGAGQNFNDSKENFVSIEMPPDSKDVTPKPRRSESNESLLDADNVKSLDDVSRRQKIKKKKNKSFFKTWKGIGVMALGAFATGVYVRPRLGELATRPFLSNTTQNNRNLDKITLVDDKAEEMKVLETRVKNSTEFKYHFYK